MLGAPGLAASPGDAINVFVAVATAIAAIAAWRATRQTEKGTRSSLIHERKLATLDHISDRADRYRALRQEIGPLDAEISEKQWAKLLELIGIWEHTAAGVTNGVLDIEVLNKMSGGNLLATYRQYARFIRIRRRENPRIYDQLEVVIDKLLAMELCSYRVTRRTARQLKTLGVKDEITGRLGVLGTQSRTYHELLSTLVAERLDTEKTLIMSCSREDTIKMRPAESADDPQILQLFERVYEATEGAYPPRVRVNDEGGIEEWLALPPQHDRLVAERDGQIVGYVELEDLGRLGALKDGDWGGKRRDYWNRAFADQESFLKDPSLEIEGLMILKRLAVDPALQKQGIGRLLLRHAIHVIQFSHSQVAALVVLATLEPAIKLYESEGATRIGEFRGHAGDALYSFVF